jgi:micrococcal nuclease
VKHILTYTAIGGCGGLLVLVVLFVVVVGVVVGGGSDTSSPPKHVEKDKGAKQQAEKPKKKEPEKEPAEKGGQKEEDNGSADKPAPTPPAPTPTVKITRVVDGDTIEISPAVDGKDTVRLIGIDAPEEANPGCGAQPLAQEATDQMAVWKGSKVKLEFDKERTDRFGRLLAYVTAHAFVDNMLNEDMLGSGYTQLRIVPPNTKYEVRLRKAQQEAKKDPVFGTSIWTLSSDKQAQLADRGSGVGKGDGACPPKPQNTPSATATSTATATATATPTATATATATATSTATATATPTATATATANPSPNPSPNREDNAPSSVSPDDQQGRTPGPAWYRGRRGW